MNGAQAVTYDEVTNRLLALAAQNGGKLTAAQVERDERLSLDPTLTTAAALALAGSTNIFSFDEPDERAWFPFSGLVVGQLHADDL